MSIQVVERAPKLELRSGLQRTPQRAQHCRIDVDYSTAAVCPSARTDASAVLHFSSTWLAKIVFLMPIAEALSTLTALSPLDGRYRGKVAALAEHFSEYALIRERVR
ncbi:MAG TPA: hypothetical protein VN744_09145, partial [Casimicrobiaceae bacterium]|nr:hypothetical protein [Casimicrobiaceae bacterium]